MGEKLTLGYLRRLIENLTVGGGGVWGSITGTLSSQTDWNSALSAKASTSYVDSQDTSVLASANSYTDSEISGLTILTEAQVRRTAALLST